MARASYHQPSGYNPPDMPNIRVVHFGLGPIGAAIVKQVAARPGFRIVGAIDIDPAKVGRDLGDIVGLPKRLGARVSGDAARVLKSAEPDVVVLCTSSSIKKVLPQIETILKSRTAIVSTTEELAYPGYTHIRQARLIHAMAKKAKVAVLGTGVNPGYVCGIIQDGCGFRKNEPAIKLHMEAYLGSPETYDSIEIEGSPSLSMKIAGGIHGDVATASIVVNSIPKVLDAPPGLHTMRDLALPSFFPGR